MQRRPLPRRFFLCVFRRSTAAAVMATAAGGVVGCSTARAGDPPPPPVRAADASAPTLPQPAPPVERLLERLEAAAADHRTLTARVRMRSIQDLLDDETVRFGDLAWARADADSGTPTRFAVAFDRLQTLDGPLEAVDRRYVYDGRWLLDVDGRARTATRREVNASDADRPGDADLALGDGPFLVPLNLKKDRVLAKFEATLAGPDAGGGDAADPEDAATDHLVLVPRATTEIDAVRLDLWFDRTTRLPRRASSIQADGDRTVVDLFEIEVNPPLPDGRFDTALPAEAGWELQTVPVSTPTTPPTSGPDNR